MTPKEEFINAIDTLNKKAYDLVNQNAKGWARIAYRDGHITNEECSEIETFVNIRNAMVHGWMEDISITEARVRQVNSYIDLMVYGKKGAPQPKEETPQPQPPKEVPVIKEREPDLSITGVNSKGASIKLNNGQIEIDLKNVKSTCCDWGDEENWPSLEIMLRTNKVIVIPYNGESADVDGDTPEDYCDAYKLYYEEDGESYYDYLSATRKMLQNDIRKIFDKCDKTSIFLDGLIVNAVNISEIRSDKSTISIRLYDDTILETEYTSVSCDHRGREIDYYVKKGAFSVSYGDKTDIEYSFAINEMVKTDFEYAETVFSKAKAKRR